MPVIWTITPSPNSGPFCKPSLLATGLWVPASDRLASAQTEETPNLIAARTLPAARPTALRLARLRTAVEDHDRAHPDAPLPRAAARLLVAMFPAEDEFCGPQELLRAAGGGTRVHLVLRALTADGLLTRSSRSSRGPDRYRLHLSPGAQS